MDYVKHFLQDDINIAEKEVNCMKDCLALAFEKAETGEFEQADLHIIDALKSLAVLKDLAYDKRFNERQLVYESVVYAPEKRWF